MNDNAIGVFDSGLGGLTAVKVLEKILPNEDIVFFGDTANVPYGGKSKQELLTLAKQNAGFLSRFGVKAILIACGTVTTNALDELEKIYDTPFTGVINAGCRASARATKTKRVGVIATAASIRSGLFEKSIRAYDPEIEVFAKACPSFVGLVESGHFERGDALIERAVESELCEIKKAGVDTLLLGCTHYPLLGDVIADYLGENVVQISSGAEAAREFADTLRENGMLTAKTTEGTRRYFASGDVEAFDRNAGIFLGHPISAVQGRF